MASLSVPFDTGTNAVPKGARHANTSSRGRGHGLRCPRTALRRQRGRPGLHGRGGRRPAGVVDRCLLAANRDPHDLHGAGPRSPGRRAVPRVHVDGRPRRRGRRSAQRHPRGGSSGRDGRARRAAPLLPDIRDGTRPRPRRQSREGAEREEGGVRNPDRGRRSGRHDRLARRRRPQRRLDRLREDSGPGHLAAAAQWDGVALAGLRGPGGRHRPRWCSTVPIPSRAQRSLRTTKRSGCSGRTR